MFTLRRLISHAGLVLTTAALLSHISVASAAFSTDITITGDNTFDDSFSLGTSGDFSKVSSGITSTSTYATDSSVTGPNPQAGSLFDIGDGFGFTGSASAPNLDDQFYAGFDTYLTITNLSLVDTYDVTIKLDFSNKVNADGSNSLDGFSDSELTLFDDGGEIFYSDLTSDSVFGDEEWNSVTGASGPTGGSGEELFNSGIEYFTFTLNASDVLNLDMFWTLEGGQFDPDSFGNVTADLSAFLSVESVVSRAVPTPIPATFFLVGLGLALLPLQRRMRVLLGK